MNDKQTVFQFPKYNLKKIMNGAVIACFILFLAFTLYTLRPSGEYQAKTPDAQARFDALLQQLCTEGLKPLASAKIDDKRAGLLTGEVDLNDLAYKEAVDCSKVGVNFVF